MKRKLFPINRLLHSFRITMAKTIVTHFSPDIDAACAVWLVHRFLKGWENAEVVFVPAGQTLDQKPVDTDETILHVDTGMGAFDHHQSNEETCAAELVVNYLISEKMVSGETAEVLTRMSTVVCDCDHFKDIYRENPADDLYDFLPVSVISGAHSHFGSDHEVQEFMENLLDCVFQSIVYKVRAEKEIKTGFEYTSDWGRTLAVETDNRETSSLAQKEGFHMVIGKSKNGQVRIKLRPDVKKDLSELHELVLKKDPQATWFYHASGHMLLNGSSKNPDMIPSKLSLKELIELTRVN